MKILQVTPAFPPSAHGGISTHVGLLSTGLVSMGHQVNVVTTNRYDSKSVMPFSGLRNVDGAQVFYARAYWPGRYFFAPQVVEAISDWASKVDIVHVHDTRTFVGLATYLIARDLPVSYVLTCHGSLSTGLGNASLKILHDLIIGKGLVKRASRVIALNEQEKADIVEFGVPSNTVVIVPNAIPLAGVPEAEQPSKTGTLMNNSRTILYLGRIHPIKGIDRLIDAFALIEQRHRDCRLLVVGQDHGAQRSLMRRVRNRGLGSKVEFPGPRYGIEKDQLLRGADVFVLPSYRETFPLAVLEAFASGLPVVTTDGCGIADELLRNQAALIVSSTAEMASAIERCLYDLPLARQLRANALYLLQTTYNWDKALGRISEIYREVTS